MGEFAINIQQRFIVEECCNCGISFALSDGFRKRCLEDGAKKNFYCPNGHPQHFTESTEIKLRREIEAEKKRREWAETNAKAARERADRAERRKNAYKGAATRARRRTACGVCPCCKRSFENLRRHMAAKHPKFGKAKA